MANQEVLEAVPNDSHRLSDIFEPPPTLTSCTAGWNNLTLEAFWLPPGETPEYYLEDYTVSINLTSSVDVDYVVEGKSQKATFFPGMAAICPIYHRHFFSWKQTLQIIALNLNSELLRSSANELFGKEHVELLPKFGFQDGLIYQIGLALQAELQSQGSSGRLYAETMATALVVHLLRNHSTQARQTVGCNGGLPQHKLKLVIEYMHDNLEQELSLKELAAITQLSPYHFCRAFKQATGLSPHRYLIQQRVERAKELLIQGDMSIGAIAIACGFTHQSHLHRHFKRLTGVTPKTFSNS